MSERAREPDLDVSAVVALTDDCPDLGEILRQFGTELTERGASHEFVIVLDGLGDARTARIQERVPEGTPVRLVKFNQAFGEERALASGYAEARGRIVVSIPSYLQLDPGGIHGVVEALEQTFDLVVGWRSPRVDPRINRLQSWLYNAAMRTLTGAVFHDLNSGLVGMRREVIDQLLTAGEASRFLPVLAHRRGFRVGEVKIRHVQERGRHGFFGLQVYVRRFLDVVALIFITKFTRKPMRFFGVAGGLSFLTGLAICVSIFVDYLVQQTPGSEPRNQAILIFGSALLVLGVMVFSLGLVAEIIIFTNARHLTDYAVQREAGPGLPEGEPEPPPIAPDPSFRPRQETSAAPGDRDTGTTG